MATVPLNSGNNGATQTATLAPEYKTIYERQMLKNARNMLLHQKFGRKRQLKNGTLLELRKATPLAVASTALVEGATPDGLQFEITSQTIGAKTYGAYIKGTELAKVNAFDPLLSVIAEELGAQAGETIDVVTRDLLAAGTNVQRVASRAARINILSTDILTAEELLKARTTMVNNKARPSTGSDYDAIVHPYVAADLMRDTTIKAAFNAGDHKSEIYDGYVGRAMGIRFNETTLAKVYADAGDSNTDVYATTVFGKDAYSVVDIAGIGMEMIFHGTGSAGTADPLDQFWTSGWKTSHGVGIEFQLYMLRIESAATYGG